MSKLEGPLTKWKLLCETYFRHKMYVEKCAEILPNWENMDKVPLTSKENNIYFICKENKVYDRRGNNCDISNCASKL